MKGTSITSQATPKRASSDRPTRGEEGPTNALMVSGSVIHSMSGSDDFHQRDLIAASNFSNAAKLAGVNQIIYLVGLGDPETEVIFPRIKTGLLEMIKATEQNKLKDLKTDQLFAK